MLGCETSLVTFTGIGYDERVMGNTLSLGGHVVDIPTRQKASVKSQVSPAPVYWCLGMNFQWTAKQYQLVQC